MLATSNSIPRFHTSADASSRLVNCRQPIFLDRYCCDRMRNQPMHNMGNYLRANTKRSKLALGDAVRCGCCSSTWLTSAMSLGSTPRSSHSCPMPSASILLLSPGSVVWGGRTHRGVANMKEDAAECRCGGRSYSRQCAVRAWQRIPRGCTRLYASFS